MCDELTAIFNGLGALCPEIDEIIQHASAPRWAVALEDDLVVTVDHVEDTNTLCLCADLGRPDDAHRGAVCEALLMYSSLRQSNGGFSAAVAEPSGDFQLLCDVGTRDIHAERLGDSLRQFAGMARFWQEVVAQGADASRLTPEAAGLLQAAIRC